MVTYTNISVSGKNIVHATITNQTTLDQSVQNHINIANGVTPQAMDDLATRVQGQIDTDVRSGLRAHIVFQDYLSKQGIASTVHFEPTGFYLEIQKENEETTKVKVRSSEGRVPPCPQKHIDAFNIIGDKVNCPNKSDFYIQAVTEQGNDTDIYFVGGEELSNLTNVIVFKKQDLNSCDIRSSVEITNIIHQF